MNSMDKMMNLINSPSVPPFTFALLLLMGIAELILPTGSGEYLYTIVLGNISQMKLQNKSSRLQGPNLFDSGDTGTLALPKGRKVLGKRSFVVENQSLIFKGKKTDNNKEGTRIISQGIPKECTMLQDLLHNYEDEKRRGKLIHYIADQKTLILAYETLKSKPGNMTKGRLNETLDGIS